MSFQDKLLKGLASEVKNFAKSQARSAAKKQIFSFIKGVIGKKPEDFAKEAEQRVGFPTTHFKIVKDQLQFKSSPMFVLEWLNKSPNVHSLIRDEESGRFVYNNQQLDSKTKASLINQFIQETDITNNSIYGHFDNALKMIETSDVNSMNFAKQYSDWTPGSPSIINGWVNNCFGDFGDKNEYYTMLFRHWIVGAAERILKPGSSHDGMLCLVGKPGVGKTLHFRNLLPERSGEIYCENIKNPRQMLESIIGKSIATFDELSILQSVDSKRGGSSPVEETFKQLISSQSIQVRLAYKRDPVDFKLRNAFAGTTNQSKFIKDPALSRRLWTIELDDEQRLNFDYLFANRDALWREAVWRVGNGEAHFLTPSEQKMVEENNKKYLL